MTDIYFSALYDGQLKVWSDSWDDQLHVVRCGRCRGKTFMLSSVAVTYATAPFKRPGMDVELGGCVGIFTAGYRQYQEIYDKLKEILLPLKRSFSRRKKHLLLKSGGKVDFWVTNDNKLAGRGRGYDLALIGEAVFAKSPEMLTEVRSKSIKSTLLTTKGHTYVSSTSDSVGEDNSFYAICDDPRYGFHQHYAPVSSNPFVPPDELERERGRCEPRVLYQEFPAEFMDWPADALFDVSKWFVDEQPIGYPETCQAVYTTMGTAVRGDIEYDGTAIVYYIVDTRPRLIHITIFGWDVAQIGGALFKVWMPSVFERLSELSSQCVAVSGSLGMLIKDASMNNILLQRDGNLGWSVNKIGSALTGRGEGERAIMASGYHYRSLAKILRHAYEKVAIFRGEAANHPYKQVSRFHLTDKKAYKYADDLLDDYTYGLIIAFGNGDTI